MLVDSLPNIDEILLTETDFRQANTEKGELSSTSFPLTLFPTKSHQSGNSPLPDYSSGHTASFLYKTQIQISFFVNPLALHHITSEVYKNTLQSGIYKN